MPNHHELRATGQTEPDVPFNEAAREAKLDRLIRLHTRIKRHLWVALLVFQTDPTQATASFDSTTLIDGPKLGCYLCEQEWDMEIHGQPCPGDPVDVPGGPW